MQSRCHTRLLVSLIAALLHFNSAAAAPKTKYHGDWYAEVKVDKMTDAKSCIVSNRRMPFVTYEPAGTLIIDYTARGGVKGYQYRIDSGEASPYQSPRRDLNDLVLVSDIRQEFATAKRLLVQGVTYLAKPINLEITLTGITEAGADAMALCSPG